MILYTNVGYKRHDCYESFANIEQRFARYQRMLAELIPEDIET
jgi:hypothetical protein